MTRPFTSSSVRECHHPKSPNSDFFALAILYSRIRRELLPALLRVESHCGVDLSLSPAPHIASCSNLSWVLPLSPAHSPPHHCSAFEDSMINPSGYHRYQSAQTVVSTLLPVSKSKREILTRNVDDLKQSCANTQSAPAAFVFPVVRRSHCSVRNARWASAPK